MSLRTVYSQFLRHEDVEDYSLRYAPSSFRKWSPRMVASAGLGGTAALFPFAISAVMVNQYGTADALIGNLIASVFCVLSGTPIANAIARYNLDMDLLTRGAGFGYFGSTITSLIYATFTFIFFAFEGAIMAQSLQADASRTHPIVGWIVMRDPPDYPGQVIARLVTNRQTPYVLIGDSLAALQAQLPEVVEIWFPT